MHILVVLSLILASTSAINIMSVQTNTIDTNIEALNNPPKGENNLQISNYTGPGIPSEMVSTFIKFINEIYESWDSPFDNADYLQNKLQGTYTGKF